MSGLAMSGLAMSGLAMSGLTMVGVRSKLSVFVESRHAIGPGAMHLEVLGNIDLMERSLNVVGEKLIVRVSSSELM